MENVFCKKQRRYNNFFNESYGDNGEDPHLVEFKIKLHYYDL